MHPAVAATWILLPLAFWWPWVLDDTRLDGALLSLLAALALGLSWRQRAQWRLPAGALLLVVGLAIGLAGLVGTPWPQVVGGLADRAPWLAALVVLGLAYSFPDHQRRGPRWILAGAALCAWYGVVQMLGWDPLQLKPTADSPPTAPLPGRAHASEFYGVVLVAGASLLPWVQRRWWFGALLPLAFLSGYFGLMASRLALPLGLGLVWKRQRALLLPLCLLLAGQAAGELSRVLQAPPHTVRDAGEAGLPPWASIRGRSLLYGAGLQHAASHPLGIGLGRFEGDYPYWRPLEEQRLSSSDYRNVATRRPKTPHNEVLLLLVELGWLGSALLGWGLWRLLRRADRARWTDPALAALLVYSLVRSPLSDNTPVLALAALLLAQRRATGSPIPVRPTDRPASPAAATPVAESAAARTNAHLVAPVALIGCALLALLPAPSQLVAEVQVARRVRFGLDQPADPALLQSALTWRPWDSRAAGLLAVDRSHQPGADPDQIRQALDQALRHDPADLFALTKLFKALMESGLEVPALRLLAQAEGFAPEHPAVRANRTLYIRAKADVYRMRGIEALRNGGNGSHTDMWLAQILRALAAARDGDVETARKAIQAAAIYSPGQRGRLERVARDPELNEAKVRALVVALVAGGESIAGR